MNINFRQPNRPRSFSASSASSFEDNCTSASSSPPSTDMLQPPGTSGAPRGNSFVRKLYRMVGDERYQDLIYWSAAGDSFFVHNTPRFSQEVLPSMFKHSNFSSFVRQLNMYGFHKVNKSNRNSGSSTKGDQEQWEFSHEKFQRDRPELVEEIRRKALDTTAPRRESDASNLQTEVAGLKVFKGEVGQQMTQMRSNMNEVLHQLEETQRQLAMQQQIMRRLMDHLAKQYKHSGQEVPPELNYDSYETKLERPPIFITSAETPGAQSGMRDYMSPLQQNANHSHNDPTTSILAEAQSAFLNLQQQHIQQQHSQDGLPSPIDVHLAQTFVEPMLHQPPFSPESLNLHALAVNTPLPPSPSPSSADSNGIMYMDEMDYGLEGKSIGQYELAGTDELLGFEAFPRQG
ncbi:uncharacterized protein VTP21DRAFT_116 [Calcarisporiella thermophila]|uniref:uncharacterized protein n=1 Tax=Calcarisporiella thermophila TaxID=911321 RepID=UPI003743F029